MGFDILGKGTRGRPRRRWDNTIKEEMKKANVSEEEAEDRLRWSGDVLLQPRIGKAKKNKKKLIEEK